jgi:hypothetical protein
MWLLYDFIHAAAAHPVLVKSTSDFRVTRSSQVTWQLEIARPQKTRKKKLDVEAKRTIQESIHANWLLLVRFH